MVRNRKAFCTTLKQEQDRAQEAYGDNIRRGRTDEANRILEYLGFSAEIHEAFCERRKKK